MLSESADTEGEAKMKTILAIGIWLFLIGSLLAALRLLLVSKVREARLAAVVACLSSAWLVCGTAYPWIVGPHHSSLRYVIIAMNLLAVTLTATALGRNAASAAFPIGTCVWIGLGWIYALIVSTSIA